MTRPLIAVVGREVEQAKGVRGSAFGAGRLYLESIARAGGLPVIVPPLDLGTRHDDSKLAGHVAETVSRCDGVVLHGGGDIDPLHYGQEPTTDTLYGLNERHDVFELAFTKCALDNGIPMLAICRGLQILNVARGGTLVQDLGDRAAEHRQVLHPVRLTEGSRLAHALGSTYPQQCHSFHHQAIDRLGAGLEIVGRSDDGVVEAVEAIDGSWTVGVQWHPEDTAAEDLEQQRLFDALVVAAQR